MQVLEFGEGVVEIGPRPRHVVHPDTDGDQIGIHCQRMGQLIVEKVADAAAAHG